MMKNSSSWFDKSQFYFLSHKITFSIKKASPKKLWPRFRLCFQPLLVLCSTLRLEWENTESSRWTIFRSKNPSEPNLKWQTYHRRAINAVTDWLNMTSVFSLSPSLVLSLLNGLSGVSSSSVKFASSSWAFTGRRNKRTKGTDRQREGKETSSGKTEAQTDGVSGGWDLVLQTGGVSGPGVDQGASEDDDVDDVVVHSAPRRRAQAWKEIYLVHT